MSNEQSTYGSKKFFVLNFFATLGLFLIMAILVSIFYIPSRDKDGGVKTEIAENRKKVRLEVQAKQQELLQGYNWLDKENGVVHIPIDTAMDTIVSELQDSKNGN